MRVASAALLSWFLAVAWSGSALAQFPPPPSATPAPGAPAGSPSTLSAAGLAPPPAIETAPAPNAAPGANAQPGAPTTASTEAALERADREDSGRGLEFVWLNAEAGFTYIDSGSALAERTSNKAGFVTGAGVGARLVFVTVGARFRYAPMPNYTFWSLGLEGGIHAPLGALEPYATLGAGYASFGSFAGSGWSAKADGFDARLGAGVDYYLTPMFSLGANVSGDLLLVRTRVNGTPNGTTGGAFSATAVAGLHF
jgi:hypothetical protein